ncbi:hypothetical protein Tco_1474514 [Tanacetum coccineum]
MIVQIKNRLITARSRQKSYADVRRKPMEFNVGDMVMLKVSPWKGVIRFGKRGKLSPRYVGPFKIIVKEEVPWFVELTERSRILQWKEKDFFIEELSASNSEQVSEDVHLILAFADTSAPVINDRMMDELGSSRGGLAWFFSFELLNIHPF